MRQVFSPKRINPPSTSLSTMIKSLDTKLADIHANPSGSKAFIIADAKDADMAFGIAAPGPRRDARTKDYESDWKSLEDYRTQIETSFDEGIVDIMLLSASESRNPGNRGEAFREFPNHASCSGKRYLRYLGGSSRKMSGGRHRAHFAPQASTTLCMDASIQSLVRRWSAPISGLYSITFTNNLDEEHQALREFQDFRLEAERKGFRYFLEVFNPNVEPGISESRDPGLRESAT